MSNEGFTNESMVSDELFAQEESLVDQIRLPESLTTIPNIPPHAQTDAQLREEAAYWQAKIDAQKSWGASVAAAVEFRDACQNELKRRCASA